MHIKRFNIMFGVVVFYLYFISTLPSYSLCFSLALSFSVSIEVNIFCLIHVKMAKQIKHMHVNEHTRIIPKVKSKNEAFLRSFFLSPANETNEE